VLHIELGARGKGLLHPQRAMELNLNVSRPMNITVKAVQNIKTGLLLFLFKSVDTYGLALHLLEFLYFR
jgi:hypothetical protein